MSLKPSVRFEVFKRDRFACVYCGRRVPDIVLEVDHVVPKSRGGEDTIGNLVASCAECNRGKSNVTLQCVTNPISEMVEGRKEALMQMQQYEEILAREVEVKRGWLRDALEYWESLEDPKQDMEIDGFSKSIKGFLNKIPLSEVKDAMDVAFRRIPDPKRYEDRTMFFFGVCWRKIRGEAYVR